MKTLTAALILSGAWAAAAPYEPGKTEALLSQGKLDKAIVQARRDVERDDASAPLYNVLGVAYRMKGRLEDAQEAFESAIACDASDAKGYFNLADIMARKRQWEDAQREADNGLGLDPRSAEGRLVKGEALEGRGLAAEALEQYRKAAALNPRLPAPHFHLGRLAAAKDAPASRREFEQFLALERAQPGYKEERVRQRVAEAEKALK